MTHIELIDQKDKEIASLKDWKQSAMNIMNNIGLQECAELLKVPLGSDVSIYILPAIKEYARLKKISLQ